MLLIVISLVGSAVLLVVFAVAAWCGGGRAVAWHLAWPKRLLVLACMAAMLMLTWMLVAVNRERSAKLATQRASYPLVSLADRLKYETRLAGTDDVVDDAPLAMSSLVKENLQDFERRREWTFRASLLERLHDKTTNQFVDAQGFGPVRMRQIDLDVIDLPEPPLVPVPQSPPYSPDLGPSAQLAGVPELRLGYLQDLHRAGLHDMFVPQRMGYIRDRTAVAGFQSHAFSKMPAPTGWPNQGRFWNVVRLELVGLLREGAPVAYKSDHLPNMRQLAGTETRSLDAFELNAVESLRLDQDVVVDQQAVRIRMIGALRAANDCLQCHEVRRGHLLGGLSYELVPVGTPTAPKPPKNLISAG